MPGTGHMLDRTCRAWLVLCRAWCSCGWRSRRRAGRAAAIREIIVHRQLAAPPAAGRADWLRTVPEHLAGRAHPQCLACWNTCWPGRALPPLPEHPVQERCCSCGILTWDGIYAGPGPALPFCHGIHEEG